MRSRFPGPEVIRFPSPDVLYPVGDATLWASESAGRGLTREREGDGGIYGMKRRSWR